MDTSSKAEVYRGREPRQSPLWQLLDNHFDEFEYRYDHLGLEKVPIKLIFKDKSERGVDVNGLFGKSMEEKATKKPVNLG